MRMTMGIMGGTFDPVHNGHIAIAELALLEGGIDQVLFIPTGDPPHKRGHENAEHRLKMVSLALDGRPGFLLSDMEILRKGITYTVDTVAELRAAYPDEKLYYIVGSDTLMVIETWRMFPVVAEAIDGLIVVPRPDTDQMAAVRQSDYLKTRYGLEVRLLETAGPDISSTNVRTAICQGDALDILLPPSVIGYIERNGLYLNPIKEKLRRALSHERYRHSLGVERESVRLARRFQENERKTRIAALLHDCAKQLKMTEMREIVKEANVQVSEAEWNSPQLLHSIVGALAAKTEYGITDSKILDAIRWHTVGRGGMTKLEKIIYLADAVEPGRRKFAGIDGIREAAQEDLDKAVYLSAKRTYEYVLERNMTPDRHTEELLHQYKPQGGQT